MRNLKALVAEPEAPPAPAVAPARTLTRNGQEKRDRPDRLGQRLVAGHVDADTFKIFKILCAEQGATVQGMVSEAIELLFKKYHKPVSSQLSEQARARD